MSRALLAEGKTKQVFAVEEDPSRVDIFSKEDITAGDGKKHDILKGKADFANRTTCNVFRLLKSAGIPVAFDEQTGPTSFRAPRCRMLPYEVVVRREAHGSYLKRNPSLVKGRRFEELLLEYFLKTSGKKWKAHSLICDDPLIGFVWSPTEKYLYGLRLYNPAADMLGQDPFLILLPDEVLSDAKEVAYIKRMGDIAKSTFLSLETAWNRVGCKLVDFKVEFGVSDAGELLLADVIDNDSWRVIEDGAYLDKQVYRDGGGLDEVIAKYARVADITDTFNPPPSHTSTV
ncbi:MAG: hypothetical protein A3C06_04120 [Candidatus Taylorbacteria bacterium RIFCSPHIGHO2_02_FULL_46_13]|uniref:phosphoribosylaminoimidazolesuccinocarboxamide synthase n=1 Tax=Candidatus Taylorbacteria bacterium RIFCSPHIGHO2_02_FULL_46_13 TaxID=1802312 RepID=A0A1G2MWR8_9BACT|nr:MAG: hypothetical protein A3C06_04120 [Candidatus Taylorbacteria bacterium RIFCSPHIGHO2_02_FULL_46_13]